MAVHYTERAALLDLPASKKLVLMCIADSANQDNRVGFPGLDAIKKWSGLKGNSRVYEVLAELVEAGLLVRHRAGTNGRRAEFTVFPRGCCALHAPLPGYEESLSDREDPGSGTAEPDNFGSAEESEAEASGPGPEAEKSQAPVQGPVEGPVWTGPLRNSPSPVVTSGGVSNVSRDQDHGPPPLEALPSSPPPAEPGPDGGDPEPPRTCSTGHPPGQPCPRCGDARRAHEEWEDRQIGRRRAAEDAERRLQQEMRRLAEEQADRCRLCDGQWVTVRAVVRPRRPGQELSHRDVRLQCKHNDAENRSIADRRANMGNLDELRERYGSRPDADSRAG